MEDKPKFNKFAVTAFVLILSSIVLIGLGYILDTFVIHAEFLGSIFFFGFFSSILTLTGLILAIISLKEMKKENLRGKVLAWIAIVIPIIYFSIGIILTLI